jgi:hypothetical protein
MVGKRFINKAKAALVGVSLPVIGVGFAVAPTIAVAAHASAAPRPVSALQSKLRLLTPPRPGRHDKTVAASSKDYAPKGLPGTTQQTRARTNAVGPSALLSGGPYYFYAEGHQDPSAPATTSSVAAQMDIANPGQIPAGGDHSLAEIAVSDSSHQQIVEVGWNVDPDLYGDTDTHLFVYHWVNGNSTCYNACGWVDYSGNTVDAGSDISGDVGTLKTFSIQYDASSNDWWVRYNGGWLGYFPATLWSGATPSVTFTTTQQQQFFGEIESQSAAAPCDDMGKGVFPSGTSPARIGSVTYQAGATAPSLALFNTDASYYYAQLLTGSIRSFAYGGPGDC